MILAAIDWLAITINLLLVVFVIVCLLMTLVILMQRPKQEGLGAAFGAGVTDQVFGARTTNVLQRGTVYLGSLFFIISLALAVLIGAQNKGTTMVEEESATATEAAAAEEPAAPEAPPAPASLADELPPELVVPDTTETPAAEETDAVEAPETTAPEGDAPADSPEAAPADESGEAPADEATAEETGAAGDDAAAGQDEPPAEEP